MRKEDILQKQISQYIQAQYPDVIFRFDLATGGTTTIGMAMRNKAMNPHLGYPDLFIAKAKGDYHGLFIELKAVEIFNKNGKLKSSEHLNNQRNMLNKMMLNGYYAAFGIGFEHTKNIIDTYLNKK